MSAAHLFEISAEDVADTSDDHYTPRWIFNAAGLMFDMDVSAPVDPVRRTCPAHRYLTPIEDGLSQPWSGLVWMNPPWSNPGPWVDRFVVHRYGLALLPATRAAWSGPLLRSADALALLTVAFVQPWADLGTYRQLLLLVGCGEVAFKAVRSIAAADVSGACFGKLDL